MCIHYFQYSQPIKDCISYITSIGWLSVPLPPTLQEPDQDKMEYTDRPPLMSCVTTDTSREIFCQIYITSRYELNISLEKSFFYACYII